MASLIVENAERRRHRILHILRRSGMRPDELRARLEESQPITILDVRSREDVTAAPYSSPVPGGSDRMSSADAAGKFRGRPR
jgi:hypothetical protein